MKYIKTYEKLHIGDIVVCNKAPYKPSDNEYKYGPKIGRYYKILNVIYAQIATFLEIQDIKTGEIIKQFNKIYFIPEVKYNANKFNL